MKSLFTMGFSGNPFMAMAQPRLGQQALPDSEKSRLYDQLVDTEGKQSIIDEWKKNHDTVVIRLVSSGLHRGVAVVILHYAEK